MTRLQLGLAAVGAVALAALAVTAPMLLLGTAGIAAAFTLIYVLGRCRHAGPLGLLPPTTGSDGIRTPSRWYCDACGRSWPANLEPDRAPIVRFSGFDQTKLPVAARRAAALDRQRHSLAVRRAGLAAAHRSVAVTAPANVTSISEHRAVR
jgi:hypothetical protein